MTDLAEAKEALIQELIKQDILKRKDIIAAFRKVPREEFVLESMLDHAYDNYPLPIGEGQTISQPLTVAFMTEALDPGNGQKVLEVGAGCGYQAALLAEIVGDKGRVITVDILEGLVEMARANLKKTGYDNVDVVLQDGSTGYNKEAPYDRIIVTASAPAVPTSLIKQLKKGGKLVLPIGDEMFLIEKNDKITRTFLGYFVFVPLIGKEGHRE